jgi:hypothetical protein
MTDAAEVEFCQDLHDVLEANSTSVKDVPIQMEFV